MKNKELSILLSKGLIFLGMAMAAAMSIWLPSCIGWLEEYYYKPLGHVPSCIMGYAVMALAIVLLVFLYLLLRNISQKKVFVKKNADILGVISACCFISAAILFAWGLITFLEVIFLVAFIAGFMGIILQVLKNVFEAAVSIKEESDYTI